MKTCDVHVKSKGSKVDKDPTNHSPFMKVFVATYQAGGGKKRRHTEVHETRAAAEVATQGRSSVHIEECEVGASWQTRIWTWRVPEQLEIEKELDRARWRSDTFEQEVYRLKGRLAEETAKVAALEEELASYNE